MKHFSMKRNILSKCLYGMMALGLLASCSNEPLLEDNKILEHETTTYVRITLVGEGLGSRADFVDGDDEENKVNELTLAFFDVNRNLVANQSVKAENLKPAGSNNDLTVAKILSVVVPVNLNEGAGRPAWVVAYVNPTQAASDLEFRKLEDLMTRVRERDQVSHKGYRTMNNSVYYNTESGNVRYATPVDFDKQFKFTEKDAEDSTDPITITVERVEAKVKVNNITSITSNPVSIENNAPLTDGEAATTKYYLKFVPEAWFVNATEKRTFLIKNYRSDKTNYTSNMSALPEDPRALNALFYNYNTLSGSGFFNSANFNDATKLRSYWAIDPTYFAEGDNNYPDVSYDVKYQEKDNDAIVNNERNDSRVYPLLYRSFNKAIAEYKDGTNTSYMKFENGAKLHEYVLENTMSLNTLIGSHAMASMTAVELIGHYVLTDAAGNTIKNDEGKPVFDGSTDSSESFYISHEGTVTNPSYKFMLGDAQAIDFFLQHAGNMLYVKKLDAEGKPVIPATYEILRAGHLTENNPAVDYGLSYSDFGLVYPEKTITNNKKLSEQWRTLSLVNGTNGYNENIYIYDSTAPDKYKKVSELSEEEMTQLNINFYNKFGVVERFSEGKAHFTVPLKHLWYDNGDNPNSNVFDVTNVGLGWYGVVRNHVYDLTINSISGLGSGIGSPEQPIVPPTDNQQYYISARLNILQWRMVSQSVDL